MQLRFFHIPAYGDDETVDSLNKFLRAHRVAAVDRHFVQDGANSGWAVCVDEATGFLTDDLLLDVKTPVALGRSRQGLSFCGYCILPGKLLLSRRRKRRYGELRGCYERDFEQGRIDERQLQAGYSTAFALTAHADAAVWRREHLRRQPLAPALVHV